MEISDILNTYFFQWIQKFEIWKIEFLKKFNKFVSVCKVGLLQAFWYSFSAPAVDRSQRRFCQRNAHKFCHFHIYILVKAFSSSEEFALPILFWKEWALIVYRNFWFRGLRISSRIIPRLYQIFRTFYETSNCFRIIGFFRSSRTFSNSRTFPEFSKYFGIFGLFWIGEIFWNSRNISKFSNYFGIF